MKVVNLYKEPYDVYIGRAGKGKDGYFGNPVSKNKPCPKCKEIHVDNGETLECYRDYLRFKINNDAEFKRRFLELDGKTLGCFCKPKACHGDIMIEELLLLKQD